MTTRAIRRAQEAVVAKRWILQFNGAIHFMQVMLASRNESEVTCAQLVVQTLHVRARHGVTPLSIWWWIALRRAPCPVVSADRIPAQPSGGISLSVTTDHASGS